MSAPACREWKGRGAAESTAGLGFLTEEVRRERGERRTEGDEPEQGGGRGSQKARRRRRRGRGPTFYDRPTAAGGLEWGTVEEWPLLSTMR